MPSSFGAFLGGGWLAKIEPWFSSWKRSTVHWATVKGAEAFGGLNWPRQVKSCSHQHLVNCAIFFTRGHQLCGLCLQHLLMAR